MKYKIAGTLACLIILTIALMPLDETLDGNKRPRVHQHIETQSVTKTACIHEDDVF